MGQLLMAMLMPLFLLQTPNPNPNPSPEFERQLEQQIEKAIEQGQIGDVVAKALQNIPWHEVTVWSMLTGISVPLGFFTLVALIVWMVIRNSQSRSRARMEFQRHLLDKFSSGREFAEFLDSKGGQRFLEEAWSPQASAKDRIVRTVRTGVVLTVLGGGFFVLSAMRRGFAAAAVILLALGIGFLLSALVSYRLSEKLGLESNQDSEAGGQTISQA